MKKKSVVKRTIEVITLIKRIDNAMTKKGQKDEPFHTSPTTKSI